MKIEDVLVTTLKQIIADRYDISAADKMVMIEIPKDNTNGDYSTNLAMRLTKLLKRRPQEIAAEIREEILARLREVDRASSTSGLRRMPWPTSSTPSSVRRTPTATATAARVLNCWRNTSVPTRPDRCIAAMPEALSGVTAA